jgi:hypothetical protein
MVAFGLPGTEGSGNIGGGHVAECGFPVHVRRMDGGHFLAGQHGPEPVAFHFRHMADDAEKREAGWRDGPFPQLVVG